jgi:hypothetical protein
VRVAGGAAGIHASLAYQLRSELAGHPSLPGRIAPHVSNGARTLTFRVPRVLRRNPRFDSPVLVVSNGGVRPQPYTVSSR